MATFKLDIRKQYGQFNRRIYAQGAAAPEFEGVFGSIQEVLASLDQAFEGAGMAKGDGVIFRNIEYSEQSELRGVVLHAPY